MAMTMRIMLIIITILQFLFPFIDFDVPEVPEEETTTAIVEETTTEEQPTFDEGCRHAGGKATCYSKAVCELCGLSYGETASHNYVSFVTEVTCTDKGYTTYKCTYCNYSYVGDETEATGHNYSIIIIEPTCTESGRTAYVCENCGDSYSENEVPALSHDYEMTEILPDCVNLGNYVYTCKNCGDSYKEVTDKPLGHNYVAIVTAPTCRNGGYTTYTCPGCNDSYTADETPALGHSFTNYVSDGNATCKSDGTKTAYCDNGCNNISTLTDEGSQLPHVDENNDNYCDHGGEELYV